MLRSVVRERSSSGRARKFTKGAVPAAIDAIVIGSGPGGLSCAVALAKAGSRVLVLEQHYVAGGASHTFSLKGYTFDTGLHYIGANIWDEESTGRIVMDYVTDQSLKWQHVEDVGDVSFIDNKRFDFKCGREQLRMDLKTNFPSEEDVIDLYFEKVQEAKNMAALRNTCKLLPRWLQGFLEEIVFGKYITDYAAKTTLEVLETLGASQELIGRLCYLWGYYGLPPGKSSFAIHAVTVNHYLDGGAFPIGGPVGLAEAATKVIEKHGGAVLGSAVVERVLMDANGHAIGVHVGGPGEADVFAPVVISAVGVGTTYTKLVPHRHGMNTLVPQSCAHISLFVGLKGTSDELGLPSSNVWVSPTFNHDRNCLQWNTVDPSIDSIENATFPALFVTFPSAKDPSWADRHPGKSACIVLGDAPYEWFNEWRDEPCRKRGESYNNFKNKLTHKLLAVLHEHFPQCKGRVEVCELGTPITAEHFLGAMRGASYGLAATPGRSVHMELQPTTSIPGLYLTGQDIMCASGVLGAAYSGIITALTVDSKAALPLLQYVVSSRHSRSN